MLYIKVMKNTSHYVSNIIESSTDLNLSSKLIGGPIHYVYLVTQFNANVSMSSFSAAMQFNLHVEFRYYVKTGIVAAFVKDNCYGVSVLEVGLQLLDIESHIDSLVVKLMAMLQSEPGMVWSLCSINSVPRVVDDSVSHWSAFLSKRKSQGAIGRSPNEVPWLSYKSREHEL